MKEQKMKPVNPLFMQQGESIDAYMERSAGVLDTIRHYPERMKADPVLSRMSKGQLEELKNEISHAMEPEIISLAREIARILGVGRDMEDCFENARSYLWIAVYQELHKYNNPDYLKGKPRCSFRRFVRIYKKYTINKVLSEETGLKCNTVKYVNRIRKARKTIAWELEVDEDSVSAEQIYARLVQMGCDEPSLQTIRDLLPHLRITVPIEDVDEKHLRMVDKGYEQVEKASFEEDLENVLKMLSPLQALLFLKHKMADKSHGNLDLLAADSKIIALCKADKTYGEQYKAIMKLGDEQEIRQGLHRLMKKIGDSAATLFRKYARQRGLEPDDLVDLVGDWALKKLAEFE